MHLNCILRRIIALFIALAILAGCDRDCDCHNEPVPEAADSERIEFRVFHVAEVLVKPLRGGILDLRGQGQSLRLGGDRELPGPPHQRPRDTGSSR